MALYGDPGWATDLTARRRSQIVLRRVERRLAIRVAMGYRTISYESAMVLAGIIPCAELTASGAAAKRVVVAILLGLEQWIDRCHGQLSFRVTQVLTGHGSFAQYLCRIGREETPKCHHCGVGPDTAEHTVEECPAWARPCHYLECEVGTNVSVNVLV
ncbi:uncharacterized protein LOC143266158 [Megachile rotundata]|uniref:uncharacterized protein LOC143266158 n=1 Tax=Megachile rotundata TaxID=143995 RepID=UPI003FD44DBE